jgi:hypothetical protein
MTSPFVQDARRLIMGLIWGCRVEKTVYLCDAGPAVDPCRAETRGYPIMMAGDAANMTSRRFDLCAYHVQVLCTGAFWCAESRR